MQVDLAFILRGRPGLGHLMPGYALAAQAAALGYRVAILTYANGYRFLMQSDLPENISLYRLECEGEFRDWPGLDLYDHGLRDIVPLLEKLRPRLCCFGGEYLLAPLNAVLPCRTAMLFNPEIFESNPKNLVPSTLFLQLFDGLDHLVPLTEPAPDVQFLTGYEAFRERITAAGPFPFAPPQRPRAARPTVRVVIANGGGVSFPRSTASYSSDRTDPGAWMEQTRQMTIVAVDKALALLAEPRFDGFDKHVDIFSCLNPEDNAGIQAYVAGEDFVTLSAPSLRFYECIAVADLVVSRAGAGFLGDVRHIPSSVVVWPLAGHDEQLTNADRLARQRPRTSVARDPAALRAAMAAAFVDLPLPTGVETLARAPSPTQDVLAALLGDWE